MKAKEYRRQIEEQMQQDNTIALESAPGPRVTPTSRVEEALARLAASDSDVDECMEMMQVLKAATFDVTAFAPFAAEFQRVLQQIADDTGTDLRLRRDALEVLVVDHDETARGALERALREPSDGDIPPAVALSLLARDDHGSALELARTVLETSSDAAARAQAVRLIGTTPDEAETLRLLLSDRTESRQVRRASAAALRALAPDMFGEAAREIIADDTDFSDIRKSLEGVIRRERSE